MKVVSVILGLLVSYVSSKGCNLPPSAWCSSPEIAELCQVTEACDEYLFPAAEAPKVKISLYYESLCPFSIRFIIGQLAEANKEVGSIMDIELVPFGNANIKTVNGTTQFECQHGPLECQGNMIETCAIDMMPPAKSFFFIYCVSTLLDSGAIPFFAYKGCAEHMKIGMKSFISCASSARGIKLEKDMGDKTNSLNPKKTYVPWILVNGVHTEDLQNQAQGDLVALVCKTYKGSDKPAACSKYTNNVTFDSKNY